MDIKVDENPWSRADPGFTDGHVRGVSRSSGRFQSVAEILRRGMPCAAKPSIAQDVFNKQRRAEAGPPQLAPSSERKPAPPGATAPSIIGQTDELGIPDFDVDNMCAKAYGSTEIQGIGSGAKRCILQMQSGYDAVKSVWSDATPNIKQECVRRNQQVPQSNPFKY